MEIPSDKTNSIIINQYVQKVVDFSSQYGSDYSISYTACNLVGRPSKYPEYGDFPETYAMRTHGDWWEKVPSHVSEFMPQNCKDKIHDFIVIEFEEFVFPISISIFETYNPGAIVKLWAFTISGRWKLLWSCKPEKLVWKSSRLFSPPIKQISLPTKIIRIEFNHSELDYYTQLDAVLMEGRSYQSIINHTAGCISAKTDFEMLKYINPYLKRTEDDCHSKCVVASLDNTMVIGANMNNDENYFTNLPLELLYKITAYLDLISLFRMAQVCKQFYAVATNPFMYNELNLKPYWHITNSNLLNVLSKRATTIRKLDLSWCGMFNAIRPADFQHFIAECGSNLTHLRLNSCSFLNSECIELIGVKCLQLKELSLRNFKGRSHFLWGLLPLRFLERLDLFRSVTDPEVLFSILKNNPNLKHLNLGFSDLQVDLDQVASFIGKYNKQMISIDFWKSHSLSSFGIQSLSECHNLEEIDFGWCLRDEVSPGESLKTLLKNCKRLKKIFLAATRGISDMDLENIANYCMNLEQLDLTGILGISTEKCYKIILNCKQLKLIDLSFCDQLDDNQIATWSVNVKRNFEQYN